MRDSIFSQMNLTGGGQSQDAEETIVRGRE